MNNNDPGIFLFDGISEYVLKSEEFVEKFVHKLKDPYSIVIAGIQDENMMMMDRKYYEDFMSKLNELDFLNTVEI